MLATQFIVSLAHKKKKIKVFIFLFSAYPNNKLWWHRQCFKFKILTKIKILTSTVSRAHWNEIKQLSRFLYKSANPSFELRWHRRRKEYFSNKKKSAGNFACGAIDRFISKLEKEEQGSHMNLETAHPGGMLWCHRWRKNIS